MSAVNLMLLFLFLLFFSCTDIENYINEHEASKKLTNKTISQINFDYFLNYESPHKSYRNFSGYVTLIDFWAYWCDPCIKSIPSIVEFNKKYKDKNFRVISITSLYSKESKNGSSKKELKKLESSVDSLRINYPVFIEVDQKVHREFFVESYPTAVLIGKDSEVLGYGIGIKGIHNLLEKAEAILNDNQ